MQNSKSAPRSAQRKYSVATLAKAGSYQVRCGIHPKMKIDVTVQ